MIFIIMVNGNGRPPACKMQEARTGNYILIWSGLIASLPIPRFMHAHSVATGGQQRLSLNLIIINLLLL